MSEDTIEAVVDRLAGDDGELRKQLLAYGRAIERDHQLDRELGLLGVREEGHDVMTAAAKHLRARGVDLDSCSQAQLFEALKAVSAGSPA